MIVLFFFFQAEDGIRDGHVTGVQTCALPISAAGQAGRHRPCLRSPRKEIRWPAAWRIVLSLPFEKRAAQPPSAAVLYLDTILNVIGGRGRAQGCGLRQFLGPGRRYVLAI